MGPFVKRYVLCWESFVCGALFGAGIFSVVVAMITIESARFQCVDGVITRHGLQVYQQGTLLRCQRLSLDDKAQTQPN